MNNGKIDITQKKRKTMTAEYVISTDAPRSIIIQGEGSLTPFVKYMDGEIIETFDGELCEIPFTNENALKLRIFLKGKDFLIPSREKKTLETLADNPDALTDPDLRWNTKLTDLKVNKLAKGHAGIKTEWDLVHYLPLRYLDKTNPQKVSELILGEWAVIVGTIVTVDANYQHNFVKIVISDVDGQRISASFFKQMWLARKYKIGDEVVIYGNYSIFVNKKGSKFPQITNPQIDTIDSAETATHQGLGMVPIYPQKSQNKSWAIKLAQEKLLNNIIWLDDPVPEAILKKYNLVSRTEAYKKIHFPNSRLDIENARRRIAFDEYVRLQVFIKKYRTNNAAKPSASKAAVTWAEKFKNSLGFTLTSAQERVSNEILVDMKSNAPMYRLLQGDVGSGKAQPLYSKVLTPNGFIAMGDIQLNDEVVTPNGEVEKVLGIFPQGTRPVYELTFKDGSQTRADINHLWEITQIEENGTYVNRNRESKIVNTQFLIDNLKTNQPIFVKYAEKIQNFGTEWNFPVTAYQLGLLLGDISEQSTQELQKLGISTYPLNIPEKLLNSKAEFRLQLLQGILDKNGTTSPKLLKNFSFETNSASLAKTILYLVRSLDGRGRINKNFNNSNLYEVRGWLSENVPAFTVVGKKETYNQLHPRNPKNQISAIASIEYVGEEETQCILISGENHLYITDDFIVTHNTEISSVATLVAVESGYQVAFLAPTDILATQLFERLTKTFRKAGISETELKIALYTGKVLGKKRTTLLEAVKKGEINIVVGTHALAGKNVEFQDLGLAVIDEMHKFGAELRTNLRKINENGSVPDLLMMSATPIPRTMAQVLYGNLDVSIVDELPAERIPIHTEWHTEPDEAWVKIREEVEKGHQAYVVAALVEDSDKLENVESAVAVYTDLQNNVFPDLKVGLLHGKLNKEEKNEVISKFYAKEIQILVATSVVEVGVNVPNATVMTILNANRFGIASLHQIRGRVGRGAIQSYCYLVGEATMPEAEERLSALVASNDGFWLAEKDLEIRGEGSIFSTFQSGDSDLFVGNLKEHKDLIELTKKVAKAASSSVGLNSEIDLLYKDRTILA